MEMQRQAFDGNRPLRCLQSIPDGNWCSRPDRIREANLVASKVEQSFGNTDHGSGVNGPRIGATE